MSAERERLYLDHNASAPLVPAAREALHRALGHAGGNPSSAHLEGRAARRLIEDARELIAARLGAPRDAVVFTSGGTEANALGLASAPPGGSLVVLATEHPSLLAGAAARGSLTPWLVDAEGRARFEADGAPPAAVRDARPQLVAASLANHETGTLQDRAGFERAARSLGAALLLDACQAVGRMPVAFDASGASLMSVASHKIGGPSGIGALLVGGRRPSPVLRGGGQEDGLRAGTESAWLAPAFAAALDDAVGQLEQRRARWSRLRARLIDALADLPADVVVNSPRDGLPNTLNVSFLGRPGPALVRRLDLEGVAVSHGAACATGSSLPSPVLLAQGLGDERARSCVRISFGPEHDEHHVDRLIDALRRTMDDVRIRTP